MAVKVLVDHLARWSTRNVGILPGPLNALATVMAWSYFAAILFVFDPLLRIALLFGKDALHLTARIKCFLLQGIIYFALGRLEIVGEDLPDPDKKYLIVMNHQSFLEGILPLSVLGFLRPTYICKQELGFGLPAISFYLRNGGHALIDRNDASQSLGSLGKLGRRLGEDEVSPVFFPEGTRSKTGRLLRFKRAGFVQILDKAPESEILPVVIDGAYAMFPRGFGWVQAGTTIKLHILPPLKKPAEQDSSDFIQQIEAMFKNELVRMRAEEHEPSTEAASQPS